MSDSKLWGFANLNNLNNIEVDWTWPFKGHDIFQLTIGLILVRPSKETNAE